MRVVIEMRYALITVRNLFLTVLFVYMIVGVFLYTAQDRMILIGDDQDFHQCDRLPAAAIPIEHNGERFFYANNSEEHVVVFYHGNAASGCAFDAIANVLETAGVSYVLSVYPGFAGDMRSQSVGSMLEYTGTIDDFIRSSGYDPGNTMLVGYSIGGAAAAYHSKDADFNSVFLISPFRRLSDVVSDIFPIYPSGLMLRQDLTLDLWLGEHDGDISIYYTETDTVVPAEHSSALIDHLEEMGKVPRAVAIDGSDHNIIMLENQLLEGLHEAAIDLKR